MGEHDARDGNHGIGVAEPGDVIRSLRVEGEAADRHRGGSQGGTGLLEHDGVFVQGLETRAHGGEAVGAIGRELHSPAHRRHRDAAFGLVPEEGIRLRHECGEVEAGGGTEVAGVRGEHGRTQTGATALRGAHQGRQSLRDLFLDR